MSAAEDARNEAIRLAVEVSPHPASIAMRLAMFAAEVARNEAMALQDAEDPWGTYRAESAAEAAGNEAAVASAVEAAGLAGAEDPGEDPAAGAAEAARNEATRNPYGTDPAATSARIDASGFYDPDAGGQDPLAMRDSEWRCYMGRRLDRIERSFNPDPRYMTQQAWRRYLLNRLDAIDFQCRTLRRTSDEQ